jgi:fatty-acyl-CoA synthase
VIPSGRVALQMLDGPAVRYAELETLTRRISHALEATDVGVGERVAIWMSNSIEYLLVYLACLKTGRVVVQLNHRHTAPEADFQLEAADVSAIFFDDSVAERVDQLHRSFRLAVSTGTDRVLEARGFSDFLARGSTAPVTRRIAPDDLAVIGFTSGTTGFPKGAELTHRSLRAIGESNVRASRYAPRSTQVFGFSLSFTSGIPAHVLPHLRTGGSTILMPTWDTERLVGAIADHHATFTILPSPPILEFCDVAESRRGSVDSLVSVLHSTARAPEAHLERLVEVVGTRLVEGWGMTENSGGLVASTAASDYSPARPGIFGSTGRAVPGTRVRAIDSEGNVLPNDGSSVGQLHVASPALVRGYWNDPRATANSFRDGWYDTGDLGTIDPDGYVSLVDRRTDLIISGGMNIYPSEVERVLAQVPGVRQCCVVGVAHERWGQTPAAFLVCSDSGLDEEMVLDFARSRLAGYKLPTSITFVETLPMNTSGKVLRRELREMREPRDE